MKTIKEAAKEYAKKAWSKYANPSDYNLNGSELDFKEGVKFAQQWIPVEEELPQKMQTEPTVSKVVQVKSKNFKEPFCAFYDHLHNIWIPYPFGSNSQILRITHWRPIELK